MEKIDHGHKLSKSKDLLEENIESLKRLFPEIVIDGKIDKEALLGLLGDHLETENERFSFSWHGKQQARRESQKPSTGTLRPCQAESINWDTTQNLYIEGDNLEVLKLLQKSYHSKVKMIYIDPPYNTGKDFVYKDNYQDNLGNYLELTKQLGEDGRRLNTNSDSSGRFHSNWLNMIYPRLKLGRNLLTNDGIIFISIDSNEVANLRKLCDEIFGEENFIIDIIWKKRDGAPNDRKIGSVHEHIIVYGKGRSESSNRTEAEENLNLMPRTEKADSQYRVFSEPSGPDPRGPFRKIDTTANAKGGRDVASLHFGIRNPYTLEMLYPREGTCWRHSEKEMQRLQDERRLYWGVKGTATTPMRKLFKSEAKQGMTTPSILPGMPFNQHAARELEVIFGKKSVFDTPKPVELLKLLLRIGMNAGDIVIDFFSGSCSTVHAAYDLSIEMGKSFHYIVVQLPEPIEAKTERGKSILELGYHTISEIGKDRIRRVISKIKKDLPENAKNIDLGFKVLKLDSSNIKTWDPDADQLENTLFDSVDNIKSDRNEEDLLYEVLLKFGLDLNLPIQRHKVNETNIFDVGMGALLASFSDNISQDAVEAIGNLKEKQAPVTCRVVFKDAGFVDDAAKTNALQILKRFGITEVRSI